MSPPDISSDSVRTSRAYPFNRVQLAPLSTTTDLSVALRYAASDHPLVLKIRTAHFLERGADIGFLSAFPAEHEILCARSHHPPSPPHATMCRLKLMDMYSYAATL